MVIAVWVLKTLILLACFSSILTMLTAAMRMRRGELPAGTGGVSVLALGWILAIMISEALAFIPRIGPYIGGLNTSAPTGDLVPTLVGLAMSWVPAAIAGALFYGALVDFTRDARWSRTPLLWTALLFGLAFRGLLVRALALPDVTVVGYAAFLQQVAARFDGVAAAPSFERVAWLAQPVHLAFSAVHAMIGEPFVSLAVTTILGVLLLAVATYPARQKLLQVSTEIALVREFGTSDLARSRAQELMIDARGSILALMLSNLARLALLLGVYGVASASPELASVATPWGAVNLSIPLENRNLQSLAVLLVLVWFVLSKRGTTTGVQRVVGGVVVAAVFWAISLYLPAGVTAVLAVAAATG